MQAELNTLESKRAAAARLIELRRRQRTLAEEFGRLQTEVEDEIESMSQDEDGHFGTLRRYFTDIIYEVLGHNAILAIRLNSQGGLDFTAEFIGGSGIAASGDRGTLYRKLLCIAFDLAMLRAFQNVRFPASSTMTGRWNSLSPASAKS